MCGIFSYLGSNYTDEQLINYSKKIVHRGPDSTNYKRINEKIFFGFHRLAINGLDPESDQPMINNGVYLICNGEIFNYKDLITKYNFEDKYKTRSDCEIIIHLYQELGIDETCKLLDGEFSFVLYDSNTDVIYIARDQLGVRSLFWSWNDDYSEISVCSELKGLPIIKNVEQFPAACYWSSNTNKIIKFYHFISKLNNDSEELIIDNIRILFTEAVEKRLMSDRKLACLLSGGLDSTTVSAIVASKYEPYTLSTYSIGLKGSVDLYYAKIAADYFTPMEI